LSALLVAGMAVLMGFYATDMLHAMHT